MKNRDIQISDANTLGADPSVVDESAIEEKLRGADTEGLGYGPAPSADTIAGAAEESELQSSDEAQTARLEILADRYEGEDIAARARRNLLRNLVGHADKSSRLQGFQTNHANRPINRDAVDRKQNKETLLAHESLIEACGRCALSENCVLKNDIDAWLDIHPYKSKKRDGDRKLGSTLPPQTTESRESFLADLKIDPMAHCDPRVRRPKTTTK